MVLAHWGQSHSEAKLAKALGTKDFGTPISNVERLSQKGYQVDFGSLTVDQLKEHLSAGRPVIARVWTAMLDYWPGEITSHVVVVVGFDDTHLYLNDPALPKTPLSIEWDSFLAAWGEFDETCAVIYPIC
jgi:uncharacterized protein YvpB